MKRKKSPYFTDFRLADVVAALQVMGIYPWASRQVEDWSKKLGNQLSADSWATIFREHPEFFRLTDDGWASLRWRHGYDRTYDADTGTELTPSQIQALNEDQRKQLTRKPLTADQTEALMKTAVDFHTRALEHEREHRWLTPFLFAILAAVIGFAGAILGALLKS